MNNKKIGIIGFVGAIVLGALLCIGKPEETTILFEHENIEAPTTVEEQGTKGRCDNIIIAYCRYKCLCGAEYESPSLFPGPMLEISGTCQNCGLKLEIKE